MIKTKQCLDCNKYFTQTDAKQKRCKECQVIYRTRGRYHDPEWKRYTKVCVDCNKEFKSKNGRAKRCDECISNGSCEICGKYIKRTRKTQTTKYCSKECNVRAKVDYYYNGNYSKVMERDNNKCQKCGTNENLAVHHIDYSGGENIKLGESNNEVDNLVVLCSVCHTSLHQNILKELVNKYKSEVLEMTEKFIGDDS